MNQQFFERLRRALAPEYRLERELRAGGQGTVYLARDATLDIPVAIKVLRPELATATAKERFQREAQILARLRHPSIVQVHFAAERDGLSFYVMDFLEGETLDRRLEQGPLSESEVVGLGQDLLAALEVVHRRGVIHRDVKPSNVFLLGDRAVLVDFGIAWSVEHEGARFTKPGERPGTYAYMPPELHAEGEASPAADIYAAGMVLYEAATGRLWPSGTKPGEGDWTGVGLRLARVLRRALAVSPQDRWRDAASFRAAIAPGRVIPGWLLAGIAALAVGILSTLPPVREAIAGLACSWRIISCHPEREYDFVIVPAERTGWEIDIGGEEIALWVARDLESTTDITVVPTQRSFATSDSLLEITSVPERYAAKPLNARYAVRVYAHEGDDSLEVVLSVYKREGDAVSGLPEIRVPKKHPERLSGAIALQLVNIVLGDKEPDLPARLSDNWEAVKDWMRGERQFQRGAWKPAVDHYHSAVRNDPAFVLAWWRLANAYRWLLESGPLPQDFFELQVWYGKQLGPVDSMLMAAQLAPAGPRRLEIYKEAHERKRLDYFPAYLLGEELFNRGPLFGNGLEEAVRVLEVAARLNPSWTAVHMHRAWVYIRLGRKPEAERAVADGDIVAATPEEVGFLHPKVFRHAYLERFEAALAREARKEFFADTSLAGLEKLAVLSRLAGSIGVPRPQLELGEMLVRRSSQISSYRADGHIAQALALVGLGRLDSAAVHFDSMAAIMNTSEARLQTLQWHLIPAALGLSKGSAAAAEARESLRDLAGAERDPALRARIAWTLILDAYGRDDAAAARGWEDSLAVWAGPLKVAPLSGLGRALERAALGDLDGALAISDSLLGYQVRTRLLRSHVDAPPPVHDAFDRAALHLLRASWYEELEDWEMRERELFWYEAADIDGNPKGGPPQAGEIDWAFGVFAEHLRGMNDLRRGEEAAGCARLGHALEIWRDAEPGFSERVNSMKTLRAQSCDPASESVES